MPPPLVRMRELISQPLCYRVLMARAAQWPCVREVMCPGYTLALCREGFPHRCEG